MTVTPSADRPIFFDRSGQPIDLHRYVELHSDLNYRIVAREQVGDRQVITAWLGLDQSFGDTPQALVFGTVALEADGRLWHDQERLAATEEQALLNHRTLVNELS